MTRDKGEEDVICAIRTAKGNHSRSHLNQREIDVIKEEVLPNLSYETDEIGIIAPYNKQVDAVKSALDEDIDVATVHKFQVTILFSRIGKRTTQRLQYQRFDRLYRI